MAAAATIKEAMDPTIRLDRTVDRTVDHMVAHLTMDRMDRTVHMATAKHMRTTMKADMATTNNSMDINNSTVMEETMAMAMEKNTKLENNVREKMF